MQRDNRGDGRRPPVAAVAVAPIAVNRVVVRPSAVRHAPIAEPIAGGQTRHAEAPPVPAPHVVVGATVAEHEISLAVGATALDASHVVHGGGHLRAVRAERGRLRG